MSIIYPSDKLPLCYIITTNGPMSRRHHYDASLCLGYVVYRADGHNLNRRTATSRRRLANEQITSIRHNNDVCVLSGYIGLILSRFFSMPYTIGYAF